MQMHNTSRNKYFRTYHTPPCTQMVTELKKKNKNKMALESRLNKLLTRPRRFIVRFFILPDSMRKGFL